MRHRGCCPTPSRQHLAAMVVAFFSYQTLLAGVGGALHKIRSPFRAEWPLRSLLPYFSDRVLGLPFSFCCARVVQHMDAWGSTPDKFAAPSEQWAKVFVAMQRVHASRIARPCRMPRYNSAVCAQPFNENFGARGPLHFSCAHREKGTSALLVPC